MTTYRARLIVFLLITAFIVTGPIYRQVFDGKNKVFRSWTMFAQRGAGEVDARFTRLLDNGDEVEIDRYEVLGVVGKHFQDMPRNTWRIRKRHGGAMEVAERLCDRLGEENKVKIYARLATRRGWQTQYDGKVLNCSEIKR